MCCRLFPTDSLYVRWKHLTTCLFSALLSHLNNSLKIIRSPGQPHGSRNHGICFIIILKSFINGVPIQFSWQFHSDMTNQASTAWTMAYFCRSYRLLPAFYAFQPIPMLIVAFKRWINALLANIESTPSGGETGTWKYWRTFWLFTNIWAITKKLIWEKNKINSKVISTDLRILMTFCFFSFTTLISYTHGYYKINRVFLYNQDIAGVRKQLFETFFWN